MKRIVLLAALLLLTSIPQFAKPASGAPNNSAVFNFQPGNSNGSEPLSGLVQGVGGVYYGLTSGFPPNGGSASSLVETAYSFVPATQTYSVIYQFPPGLAFDAPLVADPGGNLYGTFIGPNAQSGSVFELSPPASGAGAWTYTLLHTFPAYGSTGSPDGNAPEGALYLDATGNVFGMTFRGGAPGGYCGGGGCGIIFELSPPAKGAGAWTYNIVHYFNPITGNPLGGLTQTAKGVTNPNEPPAAFYGVTYAGGTVNNYNPGCGASGCGTIFQILPPSQSNPQWVLTVLYGFNGQNGAQPTGSLYMDSTGNLFGTTQFGGLNCPNGGLPGWGCGTVFELSPPATFNGVWTETFYPFSQQSGDGANPFNGALIADATTAHLYGTAYQCGVFTGTACVGTLFQITPGSGGLAETTLHTFTGSVSSSGYGINGSTMDGAVPTGNIVFGPNRTLLGTTTYGGTTDDVGYQPTCGNSSNNTLSCGTIFSVTLP